MLRHLEKSQEMLIFYHFTGVDFCNTIKTRQSHNDFEFRPSLLVMSSEILGNAVVASQRNFP